MRRLAVLFAASVALVACSGGNVFSLEVGQCFQDPEDTAEVSDVSIVECTEPHDNEVFFVGDLEGGGEFPGAEAVSDMAAELCTANFESYVGTTYDESELFIFPLTPSEESWEQDDREVVCAAFREGEQLDRSVRDSGI